MEWSEGLGSLRSTGAWLITRYRVESVAGLDPTLSNPHVLVRPDVQDNLLEVLVRDLGSRNGTQPRDKGSLRVEPGLLAAGGMGTFPLAEDLGREYIELCPFLSPRVVR